MDGSNSVASVFCQILGSTDVGSAATNWILVNYGNCDVSGGISFTVTATGPLLQYLWLFNGNPIAGGTTSAITIPNAQAGNVGNYQVIVANPAGNVISPIATLGVGNTKGADFITVSWCKFSYAFVPIGTVDHEFVNLIGSSDSDSGTSFHVTFHHNWWGAYCRERMPSVRFGRVHVFNNYYDCVNNNYCVRTRINAEVLVENNYFIGGQNPWERYVTSGTAGKLFASGNITNNCTFVNGWVTGAAVIPGTDTLGADLNPPPYAYPLETALKVPYYVQTSSGNGKYPYVP